nr:LPS assembly lipoprotein LptE [Leptospira inadai]
MKDMRLLLLVPIFGIVLNGCAYFAREPGNPPKINGIPIPDSQRTVYVQNFRNNSYGIGLHTQLSDLVKQEINNRGRFIQTREKSLAAYRIYGEISHYQQVGALLDQGGQLLSREMLIICKVELQKAGGERIPLERSEIPARVIYSDQVGYIETEAQAQTRALRILSVRISEELERAWYYSISGKIDE